MAARAGRSLAALAGAAGRRAADRAGRRGAEPARGGHAAHGGRCCSACVLSLLPAVLGRRAARRVRCSSVLPGLQLAFEVEPLGMLFALIASGLWIVNSLYSIGYMRGNDEAHQTRFYVCFALALAATMGIAFAGNLFTLFVFYEAADAGHLSAGHAPRHRRGARAAAASTSACCSAPRSCFLLPALVCDLAGRRHDRLHARRHPRRQARHAAPGRPARAVHVRHRQGRADAVPPLAAGGDGGADAGVGAAACGGGGQGRRVQRRQGHRLRVRRRQRWRRARGAASWLLCGRRLHDRRRVDRRAARRQPEAPARLLDGQPAVLRRAGRRAAGAAVGGRRRRCTSPPTRSARSRCSSPPARSTPPRTRPRSASSTASAGACPGRWARSRSARCR